MQHISLPADLGPLVRIEAVRGADLSPRDPTQPMSPLCRKQLLQSWRVCNSFSIDSPGAFGTTLSHVKCWEWLLQSVHPYALVLEDDCRPLDSFPRTWSDEVLPMLRSGDVDIVIMGYRLRTGLIVPQKMRDRPHLRRFAFEGTHLYAVTREGARKLLRHAFPVQLHVDAYIVALNALRVVRAIAWSEQLAETTTAPSEIAHITASTSVRRLLPDATPEYALLMCLLVAVLISVWYR